MLHNIKFINKAFQTLCNLFNFNLLTQSIVFDRLSNPCSYISYHIKALAQLQSS